MPSVLTRERDEVTVFGPEDGEFLDRISELAAGYPHPHSIFGRPRAAAYVRKLAARPGRAGEGWYGAGTANGDLGAVHLALYGEGDGRGHSLFKLRHPLFSGPGGPDCLMRALDLAAWRAAEIRPGTQKLVMFLGEREQVAREVVERAGWILEGALADYYRLGERCFVLGSTERRST